MKLSTSSYKNPLYNSWKDMRKRCYNPNNKSYQWYGAKGIDVCLEWNDFQKFACDMQSTWFPGATLERKDRAKGYSKENCCWVTKMQQQANRGNVFKHWEKLDQIKELRKQGMSQLAIAKKLGMSQPSVSRILLGNCKQMQ